MIEITFNRQDPGRLREIANREEMGMEDAAFLEEMADRIEELFRLMEKKITEDRPSISVSL